MRSFQGTPTHSLTRSNRQVQRAWDAPAWRSPKGGEAQQTNGFDGLIEVLPHKYDYICMSRFQATIPGIMIQPVPSSQAKLVINSNPLGQMKLSETGHTNHEKNLVYLGYIGDEIQFTTHLYGDYFINHDFRGYCTKVIYVSILDSCASIPLLMGAGTELASCAMQTRDLKGNKNRCWQCVCLLQLCHNRTPVNSPQVQKGLIN